MLDITHDSAIAQAVALMIGYSFETKTTAQETVSEWRNQHSGVWIRLAIVEALYLGRYKAVSVEQILSAWQRRGTATIHFNREFECLICRDLPRNLAETEYISKPVAALRRPAHKRNQQAKSFSAHTVTPPSRRSPPQSAPLKTARQESVNQVIAASIKQFTPTVEVSEVYWKLKAVASKP